jgi:hypothetical protein
MPLFENCTATRLTPPMSELLIKQPSSGAFSLGFTPLNRLSLQLRGTAILVAIIDCGLRNNLLSCTLLQTPFSAESFIAYKGVDLLFHSCRFSSSSS